MPTEEDLEKTYGYMSTEDLVFIATRKQDYTELALEVATRELKKRKIAPEEIKALPQTKDPYKMLWTENCLFDLGILQKAAFYFLWLPLLIFRRITMQFTYQPPWEAFKTNGYVLKGQQASFYQITGFSSFLISLVICNAGNNQIFWESFFVCWLLGLGTSLLFDVVYNRQRLTNKLNDYKETGELPWGV